MTMPPDLHSCAPVFTPRLVEGPLNAPRVVFLDPASIPAENVEDRIARALIRHGEAVFAINRYAIAEGCRRLGRERSILELPESGSPEAIRNIGRPVHAVFVATFPSAWNTGQVRSYALSSCSPTIRLGMRAHQWLADLGASASNRLLWSYDAS